MEHKIPDAFYNAKNTYQESACGKGADSFCMCAVAREYIRAEKSRSFGRAMFGLPLTCAVNPEAGRETYLKTTKAEEPKNVTVVGGGPAGMEAASTAARRGHRVTLFEKDRELGGLLNLAEKESFKYHIGYLKRYLINETKKQGVEVRLGEEATLDKIKETKPDSVIIATGSDVFIPFLNIRPVSCNILSLRLSNKNLLPLKSKTIRSNPLFTNPFCH